VSQQSVAPSSADLAALAKRSFGVLLTLAVLTAALGIALLVWPSESIVVVSVLVGIYLVVSGIFQLIGALVETQAGGGVRVLIAISGTLSLLLGLFAFRSAAHSVLLLALIIGFAWLFRGIAMTITAIADPNTPSRGLQIFFGVVLAIAGIVVIDSPVNSLHVLAVLVGIWLLVLALVELVLAFQVRSAGASVAAS